HIKARKKALAYDPLKGAKHIAKAPPVSTSRHAAVLKNSKLAKRKPVHAKPQPGLAAAYVSRPGQTPVFEPVQVVKTQAQLNAMLRKGNIDLLSAVAYCDRRGQLHTGSVLEIYSMLPAKSEA
ncbi:MAG TPA: hypothetical protein VFW62_13170, partial [bacterium]|nr:hypothetical protein [bacterium]